MLTTRLLTKYFAWRAQAQQLKEKARAEPRAHTKSESRSEIPDQKDADHFDPLDFEQAQLVIQGLRKSASLLSPGRLILLQLLVGAFATVFAYLSFFDGLVAMSVAYGAVAVVLPASVFAWGLRRSDGAKSPWLASASFFIWEVVKVGLTVVIMFAAPALMPNVNWLALVAGFVVTMKVYWVAIWLYPVRKNSV